MSTSTMSQPRIVSRAEWLTARKRLLAREKEVTQLRDAVNAERKRLPMVKVDKDYVFAGALGTLRLRDMFEGRRLLHIHHFMWIDARDTGCPGCTMAAIINYAARSRLLHQRDVSFACIARAPLVQAHALQKRKGLDLPVLLVARQRLQLRLPRDARGEQGAPLEYNYL